MKVPRPVAGLLAFHLLLGLCLTDAASAQRRRGAQQPAGPGTVSRVAWSKDGHHVDYTNQGQRYRFDLSTREKQQLGKDDSRSRRGGRGRGLGRRGGEAGFASTGTYVDRPTRGRQFRLVDSPDGLWQARYEDWNVVLQNKQSGKTIPVTTDGNDKVHYGTASWVYGEELDQRRAMWWSGDSHKLLYYRFDDTGVRPFHLVTHWSEINTEYYPEFYPKAGAKNPAAALRIYDLASRKSIEVEAGIDQEHYLYDIRLAPAGDVMMVSRTDRLQHDLDVLGIDLETGECRVIVHEHQDTWQANHPTLLFLRDQHRFLWATDKSGFTHYEVRDLDGDLENSLTSGEFQTNRLQFVDEERDLVGFTAYSSQANPYYLQYHLVDLDGEGQHRVTSLEFHHSHFSLSPDKKWLIAQYEKVDTPPGTALYAASGELVARLAEVNASTAANLAELFHFRSSDDRFEIYGILYKPEDFDPHKSYPMINALYGGPGSNEFSARYVASQRPENQRGYLVVKVQNRGTGGRGKAFLGATYLRLGDVDIQDHADAVRLLRARPYVDGDRVGIVGSSYGGYMAAMGIFKHPDVYAASVAKSAVTDWRNYDTIYTERYMSTPQLNGHGYDIGRAMTYVKGFHGKLLIMHGMIDDNVHPTNAFQLIDALDKAGKHYESRFFPNRGHGTGAGGMQSQREFFDRVLKPTAQ